MKTKKIHNIKYLKNTINKYGYKYNYLDLLWQSLGIIGLIEIIAYFTRLSGKYLLVLFVLGLILVPYAIFALFTFDYETKRFQLLTDYLSNAIPIFLQKSKIIFTLNELSILTSGKMKECVDKSINYLNNVKDDPDIFENSLKIIFDEYPNSRIQAINDFLINVEKTNSIDYKMVASNLYDDVESWIKRNYLFQKEIKDKRLKLVGLCLMTLLMNIVFVYIYSSNDFFKDFVYSPLFQISNTVFIASILIITTVILTKLNARWLINDLQDDKDEIAKKIYLRYTRKDLKLTKQKIIVDIMILILFILCLYWKENSYALILGILLCTLLFKRKIVQRSDYRYLNRKFQMEFPLWLRDIYLNLGLMTTLNAIEISLGNYSYPFQKELFKMVSAARKDPSSIKPYTSFLEEYDLEEARSSMRILYSLNNISKKDVNDRIKYLIDRNQSMLAKAQELKNNESLGLIEMIGFLPMILFAILMLISMTLMFVYMMSNLGRFVK